MGEGVDNNLIALFVHKEVTRLYKSFLETIEDLRQENKTMIDKVSKHCAPEFAEDINFFDESKHNQLRKRTLDAGNETVRQINGYVEMFDFKVNDTKVTQAAQRKITKRFTINSVLEER